MSAVGYWWEGDTLANAIGQIGYGLTVGRAGLGYWGDGVGSARRQVYDGDTVTVRADGNFGLRLLGVDAPEMSVPLPGAGFTRLSDEAWETFFRDPFSEEYPAFDPPLDDGLMEHLRSRIGAGTAENHYRHAQAAEDAFEAEIIQDQATLGKDDEDFRFFLTFSYEVMDGYGRFLCYLNREQRDKNRPEPRPKSYNERLLASGAVSPYFIWPNVDPFRAEYSVAAAVIESGEAAGVADKGALGTARKSVREARERGAGIFEAEDPLRLLAFELRFLAGRRPPSRWVIDLSREDDTLIPPQKYYTVPNPEDRLFVSEEYVPLFVEAGWRRGA